MQELQRWEPGESWQERWEAHYLPRVERAKELVDDILRRGGKGGSGGLTRYFERDVLRVANEALPGFATLNPQFMGAIVKLRSEMRSYVEDRTRRRPDNVLLIAPPGSGKSHFAKCVSDWLGSPVVTANLSGPDYIDTIHLAVEEVRNHKAVDRMPMLFLDEVDSNPELLPVLWDGEFITRGQRLGIGRCLILCALSNDTLVRYVKRGSEADREELRRQGYIKVQDFLSRFNGGVAEILSINAESRRYDKICVAMELLRRRFRGLRGVQASYLQFISQCVFLNETRSLEFLINTIPAGALQDQQLKADAATNEIMRGLLAAYDDSPLRYHLARPQESSLEELWETCWQSPNDRNMVEFDYSRGLYA